MYLNTPGVEWIHTTEATIVASLFASISIIISIVHIMQHLTHYTMPGIQLYVVRILIICPVYAISSALAVGLGKNGQYAEVARDVYEAFVIYSFLNLIMEYCGGETDCVYQIENEPLLKFPCPLCFMKPRQRDARLIRTLKRGVLQFVIIKPIFAVVDIIMIATGEYYLLPYQFFEMFVYNISYTWALYCMYLFYVATNKIIKKFRPVLKFASVKLIVFATYYQSLLVKASSMSPENAIMWNDLLLCIEMVVFASILMCAFPTSEFEGGVPESRIMNNVKDVLKIKDVVQDVYHNFMPVYQEYTLQRSDREAPETVRVKTYLAGNLDSVAIEMSHRYRGRNKRFAFNSLLRGDTPIRAHLRSRSNHFHDDSADLSCSASEGSCGINNSVLERGLEGTCAGGGVGGDDLGSEDASAAVPTLIAPPVSPSSSDSMQDTIYESMYERYMMANLKSRNGLHTRSHSFDDELNSSSDCLTANIRHHNFSLDENQEFDIETGMMNSQNNKPNVVIHQLNPIEMDIYQRRVNFMRTHGIGMIVTDHGVEVRPSSYCPTEEESVINIDFMNKELHLMAHFRSTSASSYTFPMENVAAAILPRITSSREKGKKAREHEHRSNTAVRREEELLLLQVPGERAVYSSSSEGLSQNRTITTSSTSSSSDSLHGLALLTKNFDATRSTSESQQLVHNQLQQQRKEEQHLQRERMRLLPPITAISAPRTIEYSRSSSLLKKVASSIGSRGGGGGGGSGSRVAAECPKESKSASKNARSASEDSDDWGDFQFNDKHVSPEKCRSPILDDKRLSDEISTDDKLVEGKLIVLTKGEPATAHENGPVTANHQPVSERDSTESDENSPSTTINPMMAALKEMKEAETASDREED